MIVLPCPEVIWIDELDGEKQFALALPHHYNKVSYWLIGTPEQAEFRATREL